MPVRSLNSSVLRWPDAQIVDQAVHGWSERMAKQHPDVLLIGYFGSYARGDWGVGSDVDIVIVVADSPLPFERRATQWDATELPVPADVLVYTLAEWQAMDRQGRFLRTLGKEAVWTYRQEGMLP
ncbi:MAG: nucleotidyltransferase domain-containing protein [Chloroflexi bacterium]|nr:nucleotidyltransferase domain-containing protein [Chloroflexota bacterium]